MEDEVCGVALVLPTTLSVTDLAQTGCFIVNSWGQGWGHYTQPRDWDNLVNNRINQEGQ